MTEEKSEPDSCFDCRNFTLCFLRRDLQEVLLGEGLTILNVDSLRRPKKFNLNHIYEVVAQACLEFESRGG